MNNKSAALLAAASLAVTAVANAAPPRVAEAATSRVAAGQAVDFDVYLPLQDRAGLEALLEGLHTAGSPQYQKWLTPAQFHARFDPSAASVNAAKRELTALGLTVTATTSQRLHVSGSAGTVEQAFVTTLRNRAMPNGSTRVTSEVPLSLTPSLSSLGAVVTGLSGKVRMHTHSVPQAVPENRYSTSGPYWFTDLKQAYDWPSYKTYTGKGVHIGILMTGDYQQSDMDLYFGHEKLASPTYNEVKVLGGAPFDPNGGSFETQLDLQQSGGMAPNATITLYNIPDLTDYSIIVGLSTIVNDNVADVVSMSFGGPELGYTAAYNDGTDYTSLLRAENDLMAQGNAQGITFIASSGDSGALAVPAAECFADMPPVSAPCGTFVASAEFPASSPHVTGVGGTNLVTTYNANNLNSKYIYEQAYADPLAVDITFGTSATGGYWGSGGGNSILFKKPSYQTLVKTGEPKFRSVPDLALHMGGCPGGTIYCNPDDSADVEALAGKFVGVIGTSASAPDFAGLTALNIERFGTRVGNENYYIYGLAASQKAGLVKVFHTDIPGYNGLYSTATTGTTYNRVLGNGTLYARQFLLAPSVPAAGTPQTPSNP